jgi:hypothetical protein
MATIGETRMWHDISAGARALVRIAEAIEKIVKEEYSEPEKEDLPLTKVAWRSEVSNGKTEQGFDDWLEGRRA